MIGARGATAEANIRWDWDDQGKSIKNLKDGFKSGTFTWRSVFLPVFDLPAKTIRV